MTTERRDFIESTAAYAREIDAQIEELEQALTTLRGIREGLRKFEPGGTAAKIASIYAPHGKQPKTDG